MEEFHKHPLRQSDTASNPKLAFTDERPFEKPICLLQVPLITPFNQELVDLLNLLDAQVRLNSSKRSAMETKWSKSTAIIKAQKCKVDFECAKKLGMPEEICYMVKAYDETGTIDEAAYLLANEEFNTIRSFEKVYGSGGATAKKWWSKGYRNLDDVMKNAQDLPKLIQQTLHITSDLQQPLLRQDAEEIASVIQRVVEAIDQQATVSLVGSYRRGKTELGDIDILICNRNEELSNAYFLNQCIKNLNSQGFIKQHLLELTIPKKKKHWLNGTLNTVAVNTTLALVQPTRGIVRQVDIRVVSESQKDIMKFMSTGSARFLYSLIKLAESKGFKLTPSGILDKNNKQLPVQNDEDVFRYLDIEYIEPRMRHH